MNLETLMKLLSYDPDSGKFHWRESWGAKAAGSEAGRENHGYIGIQIYGKKYSAHRLAFLFMGMDAPKAVDHINRVGTDNRWENLRPASDSQNQYNKSLSKNNSSGYKGVTYNPACRKWQVTVRANKKSFYFGTYEDIELAGLVAAEARAKHHGEFAS